MRRHTLEHDNIEQQIKSVITSPTRKFFNFKNISDNSKSILNFTRRTRRFSAPEKKYFDRLDNDAELDTIDEIGAIFLSMTLNGRPRLFSTPERQDLETIYENFLFDLYAIQHLDTMHVTRNEANATAGSFDETDIDRSRSSSKTNTDSTSKRARLQAVFSSRSNTNDKKTNVVLTNSVGVSSHRPNNTSGPGGGATAVVASAANNETNDDSDQRNVVAALAPYANTAVPVSPLRLPLGKSNLTSSASSSPSSMKERSNRRTRSGSNSDSQSVSDKSLFSKLFSKKPKKPLGTLITTTTKSINIDVNKKRQNLITQSSLSKDHGRSTINEEEECDDNDPNISTGSLSDTDCLDEKDDVINTSLSSTTTLFGSRTNSSSGKKSKATTHLVTLPTSDSQYYASMSSAPTGFSISYHKWLSKGSDDLRIQAAIGRLQQQNKKATAGGTSNLMSLFQDPNRSGTQSPTSMSGTTRTRVTTFSGQTIITRNSSSSDQPPTYCIRPSSASPTHDGDEPFISDDEIYTHFMKYNTCYDILPKSSKLVVFDTQLAVKKAFFALVYNGVRAAPLWDTKRQKFIGLLTITDFILILQKYYKEPHARIEELEEHRIETWRDVLREYERPLLSIKPSESLFEAVRILLENHVHRLPIIDPITNNAVFILTHKRILRFFYLYIYDWPQPSFMSKTLEELQIGTYDNLITIEETTTVIEALNYFVKRRISALPVVDKDRKLVNIYSKFDVIGLAPDKSYRNLNMTINEALSYRKERFEAVAKCYKHELLSACMERIVKAEVHRLVIVDNDQHVIGILSLSDLLHYIVIRPTKSENNTTTLVPPTTESNQEIA
ncbi:unnamed protein product [Rotaria sordida]|uniref:CBS domain-containing protein n=1 Tax=Rotaria sordida TaxID=392033 RepID=A0A813X0B4_9BILA|nr:unnamed protein product [Rotaria sordida]